MEPEVNKEQESKVEEKTKVDLNSLKKDDKVKNKKEENYKAKIKELEKNYQSKIKELEEANNKSMDKVKLTQAELVNYRKRKDDELVNMLKFANEDLILEILPVLDNFERAIKKDDNNLTDELSKFLSGFKLMYASLCDVLKKFGLEEINRPGEVFDPTVEEAILTDCDNNFKDDVVLEVMLKGYKLKGKVIRPASVKVNQL